VEFIPSFKSEIALLRSQRRLKDFFSILFCKKAAFAAFLLFTSFSPLRLAAFSAIFCSICKKACPFIKKMCRYGKIMAYHKEAAMFRSQKGFTLIELVIVIVVLGILAAIAIPKYVSVASEARIASVNGMAGGLRGAVALARAKYMAVGVLTNVTVDMDGTAVTCAAGSGIPRGTAAGIGAAMQDLSGYTPDYTVPTAVTFSPGTVTLANCWAIYNETTGIVTTNILGC
jgi:MSHA pilin protein MshA